MTLLICGSRSWTNKKAIRDYVKLMEPTRIISGGAAGADTLAEDIARELGIPVQVYRANWDELGAAAGPIRNSEMLESGVDRIAAFRAQGESPGTDDMIYKAFTTNKPVDVFWSEK